MNEFALEAKPGAQRGLADGGAGQRQDESGGKS
jgi:hypothetical protein